MVFFTVCNLLSPARACSYKRTPSFFAEKKVLDQFRQEIVLPSHELVLADRRRFGQFLFLDHMMALWSYVKVRVFFGLTLKFL
jgi:hypothetical protein